MNATSRRLGMTQSNWVNPNGLPAENQISSARDLAILARAMLRDFPEYELYWNIPAIKFGKKVMRNHNSLIGRYQGADGGKTGFICASGLQPGGVRHAQRQAADRGRARLAVVAGARRQDRGPARARLQHATACPGSRRRSAPWRRCSRSMPRRPTCAKRCAASTASARPPRRPTTSTVAATAPTKPIPIRRPRSCSPAWRRRQRQEFAADRAAGTGEPDRRLHRAGQEVGRNPGRRRRATKLDKKSAGKNRGKDAKRPRRSSARCRGPAAGRFGRARDRPRRFQRRSPTPSARRPAASPRRRNAACRPSTDNAAFMSFAPAARAEPAPLTAVPDARATERRRADAAAAPQSHPLAAIKPRAAPGSLSCASRCRLSCRGDSPMLAPDAGAPAWASSTTFRTTSSSCAARCARSR